MALPMSSMAAGTMASPNHMWYVFCPFLLLSTTPATACWSRDGSSTKKHEEKRGPAETPPASTTLQHVAPLHNSQSSIPFVPRKECMLSARAYSKKPDPSRKGAARGRKCEQLSAWQLFDHASAFAKKHELAALLEVVRIPRSIFYTCNRSQVLFCL